MSYVVASLRASPTRTRCVNTKTCKGSPCQRTAVWCCGCHAVGLRLRHIAALGRLSGTEQVKWLWLARRGYAAESNARLAAGRLGRHTCSSSRQRVRCTFKPLRACTVLAERRGQCAALITACVKVRQPVSTTCAQCGRLSSRAYTVILHLSSMSSTDWARDQP